MLQTDLQPPDCFKAVQTDLSWPAHFKAGQPYMQDNLNLVV